MKSVSVIIPSYNRAHLLPRCLDSVIAQECSPSEIIVVDDGSTDSTRSLLQGSYPGIKVITQANKGVSAARNAGIRAAAGDWLAFLDSDDTWFPAKLGRQVQAVEASPGSNIVHTDEIWIRNGVRVNPQRKHEEIRRLDLQTLPAALCHLPFIRHDPPARIRPGRPVR